MVQAVLGCESATYGHVPANGTECPSAILLSFARSFSNPADNDHSEENIAKALQNFKLPEGVKEVGSILKSSSPQEVKSFC